MGFLEDFEDDVFLSYASVDDAVIAAAKAGWVSQLHDDLEKRVSQMLGQASKIWRDEGDLKGNDQLTPTLIQVLEKSGALLAVVSPGYIGSKWCRREVEAFCAKHGGRVELAGKSQFRIFKVLKYPVKRDVQFDQIKEVLPYEFFEKMGDDYAIELAPWGDVSRCENYTIALYRLATDIASFLKMMKRGHAAAPRSTVYLAETTSDLRKARNSLWDDLRAQGFEVLPDTELDRDGGDYRDQVRSFLSRSVISIHLVGAKYGGIPEGEKESHVAVQAYLAGERCSDPKFRRIVWMPAGLPVVEPEQLTFVESLENDISAQPRTEFIQKPLEDLKNDLEIWLNEQARSNASPSATAEASYKRVFIVADPQDIQSGAVDRLDDYLNDQGYEVKLSLPARDEAEMLQAYQENLKSSQGCIIYYGQGSGAWVDIKMADWEKFFGQSSYPARAVYVAPPDTAIKKRLRSRSVQIIRESTEFPASDVDKFVQATRNATKPV
jgi:hypothetical protein